MLCNKLPQNLSLKQQNLLFHNFYGWRIWVQLNSLFLVQGHSWDYSQDVAWGYNHLKSCLEHLLARWLITWPLAGRLSGLLAIGFSSLPCGSFHNAAWVSLLHSSWLPLEWVTTPPTNTPPPKKKKNPGGKPHVFYELASVVTLGNFCNILLDKKSSIQSKSKHGTTGPSLGLSTTEQYVLFCKKKLYIIFRQGLNASLWQKE